MLKAKVSLAKKAESQADGSRSKQALAGPRIRVRPLEAGPSCTLRYPSLTCQCYGDLAGDFVFLKQALDELLH